MFPIQTRLLTPNQYSRPQRKLRAVKGIVIHWTANEGRGANAEANRRFFENRKFGKTGYGSAHYFVDDKEILLCLPESEMSYHVGANSYKTKHFGSYPNDCTLGIEMCVNADGKFSVVYDQTVELTAHLVRKYNLNPDKDIARHYDITGKNCPGFFTSDHWGKTNNSYAVKYGLGTNADAAWKAFIARVKAELNGTQPKPEAIKMPQIVIVGKEADEMVLTETGREEARGIIRRAVTEGLFSATAHTEAKIKGYNDSQLMSYFIAYVNRKLK